MILLDFSDLRWVGWFLWFLVNVPDFWCSLMDLVIPVMLGGIVVGSWFFVISCFMVIFGDVGWFPVILVIVVSVVIIVITVILVILWLSVIVDGFQCSVIYCDLGDFWECVCFQWFCDLIGFCDLPWFAESLLMCCDSWDILWSPVIPRDFVWCMWLLVIRVIWLFSWLLWFLWLCFFVLWWFRRCLVIFGDCSDFCDCRCFGDFRCFVVMCCDCWWCPVIFAAFVAFGVFVFVGFSCW